MQTFTGQFYVNEETFALGIQILFPYYHLVQDFHVYQHAKHQLHNSILS